MALWNEQEFFYSCLQTENLLQRFIISFNHG